MTKPQKPKARRPSTFFSKDLTVEVVIDEYGSDIVFGHMHNIKTIKDAKRLHAWLGKAILYLEQKEKKC